MSIGNVRRVAACLLLMLGGAGAACVAAAQDEVANVLESLRRQLGEPPQAVRLTGAGSGYAPAPDGEGRRHYRIERLSLEWNLSRGEVAEEVVRVETAGGEGAGARRTAQRTVGADAPWHERYLYWMAPHTFLAGAQAHDARLETRSVRGAEHRVVSFTPPGGAPVHGFFDDDGRLERIRTEVDAPSGERSARELVFFDRSGSDTPGGVADILIEKHDGALVRVLAVEEVEGSG